MRGRKMFSAPVFTYSNKLEYGSINWAIIIYIQGLEKTRLFSTNAKFTNLNIF